MVYGEDDCLTGGIRQHLQSLSLEEISDNPSKFLALIHKHLVQVTPQKTINIFAP